LTDADFWNQLLARREYIAAIDPSSPQAQAQLEAQLATLAEQYDRAFDPADNFEAYVAIALCKTVAAKVAALKLR